MSSDARVRTGRSESSHGSLPTVSTPLYWHFLLCTRKVNYSLSTRIYVQHPAPRSKTLSRITKRSIFACPCLLRSSSRFPIPARI